MACGTCSIEDTCNCFPRYGGPDCSKRLCARGLSWVAASLDEMNEESDPRLEVWEVSTLTRNVRQRVSVITIRDCVNVTMDLQV